MTVVRFMDILDEVDRRGAAVGAFTCYNLEAAAAVLDTAVRRDRPAILLLGACSVSGSRGEAFLAALLSYAERAPARCCVQVDHVNDLTLVARVLKLGAGAVMADGSRLSFDENIAFVREAVAMAEETEAAVEAELGRVEGNEDVAVAVEEGQLTDPLEAASFVTASGATCLAVSIGNVHGRYAKTPTLDWARLEAIRSEVDVPLVLHGASGIPDPIVQQAIRLGIRKVHINTELRDAYLRVTDEVVSKLREVAALTRLHEKQIEAVSEVIERKLHCHDPETHL